MNPEVAVIAQDLREILDVGAEDRRTIGAILRDDVIHKGAFLDFAYNVSSSYHIPQSVLLDVDPNSVNVVGAAYRIQGYLAEQARSTQEVRA